MCKSEQKHECPQCKHLKSVITGIVEADCQLITVDAEFIKAVQEAAQTLLTASARLNNAIREIERNCPHADDDQVLKTQLGMFQTTAGDLSESWDDLNLTLTSYDLLEATA